MKKSLNPCSLWLIWPPNCQWKSLWFSKSRPRRTSNFSVIWTSRIIIQESELRNVVLWVWSLKFIHKLILGSLNDSSQTYWGKQFLTTGEDIQKIYDVLYMWVVQCTLSSQFKKCSMHISLQLTVQDVQLKNRNLKKPLLTVSLKWVCQVMWKLNKNSKRPQFTTHVFPSSYRKPCGGHEPKLFHWN